MSGEGGGGFVGCGSGPVMTYPFLLPTVLFLTSRFLRQIIILSSYESF